MPRKKKQQSSTADLTEVEMIEILKDIARNGSNAAARIAAIKTLREIGNGERTPAEGFAELDEVTSRRLIRKKAS